MATTIWKGHLTFGLISVPVRIYAAARSTSVSFNQIHRKCGSRIKQQIFCPVCEKVVERKELAKGYDMGDDRYVIIEEEDLEKIMPASGKTIDVMEFVDQADVDPVYMDTSYYLLPEGPGEKAYYLLQEALEDAEKVGIASIVLHQREHVVIVRPAKGGIMLHTMYYQDEVREVEEYGKKGKVRISDKELDMAKTFVKSLSGDFDLSKYHDQYRENAMALIEAKAEGQTVTSPEQPRVSPVMDLMAALKASIEKGSKSEKPKAGVEPIPIDSAPSRRKKAADKKEKKEPVSAQAKPKSAASKRRKAG